ncbi:MULTISPECIES: sensor histidine kinase [Shouchella]|uniref:sensor histidine kinase n=1 Tax=Shouchella TaxID=2893057 RepID=UPI000788FDA4|nr:MULTISPECIES: sensor histidine kinase [Shouchella]MEB5478594.1 sensor histidine kinase [Shouchella clausii]PAD12739.1 histidine kinase [Shouchella clausii]GIN12025.1 signal transduction histidine-protein kinase/phosphatase DegS [Shouchella clausii]
MTDVTMLDHIITQTLDSVGTSREKIFEIGERSRNEYEYLKKELDQVKVKLTHVINDVDETVLKTKHARNRLAKVSKEFNRYTSEEVRTAYEQASDFQVQLAVLQQEEIQLRIRRDDIDRRLKNLQDTINRAEQLSVQMSVVFDFLSSDLKQVGEYIKDANEKQAFGLKIIEAQEEERRRLSREIHDGPAQMMANVMLHSELIERIYQERGIEEALKEIRGLRRMVRSSLAEVRRIIYDLRPMALDDLGLVPTLRKYLENIEERHGLKVTFKHFGVEKRLAQQFEIALFRLVQEAVQNATKHAEPTEIVVKIELKPKNVTLVIRDDGKGFDLSERKESSFGLIGMKERVNMLNGKMTIHSKPQEGTNILIQLPVSTN